jgi:flagellar protein FliS
MFGNTRAGANAYRQMGVDTDALAASPHQLVTMLFDGALRAMDTAAMQVDAGDVEGKGRSIGKAIEIVGSGLAASLDLARGGEVAQGLASLYDYVVQRLVEANIACERAGIDEARTLLAQIRTAWVEIGHAANHQGVAA